jgi:hypothetical protein
VVIGIGRATSLQLNRPSTRGDSQKLGITQPYSEDFRLVLKVSHKINPGTVRPTINPMFLPGKLRKNEEPGSDRGSASSMARCCDSTTQRKTPQKTSMIKRRNRSNDIFTSSWKNLQRSRKAPSSMPIRCWAHYDLSKAVEFNLKRQVLQIWISANLFPCHRLIILCGASLSSPLLHHDLTRIPGHLGIF